VERSCWPYTAFERHLAGWLLTATVEHEDRCRRVGEDRSYCEYPHLAVPTHGGGDHNVARALARDAS